MVRLAISFRVLNSSSYCNKHFTRSYAHNRFDTFAHPVFGHWTRINSLVASRIVDRQLWVPWRIQRIRKACEFLTCAFYCDYQFLSPCVSGKDAVFGQPAFEVEAETIVANTVEEFKPIIIATIVPALVNGRHWSLLAFAKTLRAKPNDGDYRQIFILHTTAIKLKTMIIVFSLM